MSRLGARVLTGTTLAVVAAALLWLNPRLPQGLLALVVAALLANVSAWELDRMGSFAGRGFGLPLVFATLALLVVEASFVFGSEMPHQTAPFERVAWHYGLCLVTTVPAALLGAVFRKVAR